MTTESNLEPISKEQEEEYQDEIDFAKLFFTCSEFDSQGNLQTSKWSKLEHAELPFSKKRMSYLLKKYMLNVDPKDNPRVDK